MSRVTFATAEAEAELRGSERAWLGSLCTNLTLGILNPRWNHDKLAQLMVDPGSTRDPYWAANFETRWTVGMGRFKPDIDPFLISLDTATMMGSPQMALAAWIHGQSEVHGFVEEEHRIWLAELIDDGREQGIFRDHQGWEDVLILLRKTETLPGPVVMSYSVTETFPSPYEVLQDPSEDVAEAFYGLPHAERWSAGLDWLRTVANVGPITPENLSTRRYGDITALDLILTR
jgi:hypothetical protein